MSGEDTKVDDKEREGALVVEAEGGYGVWAADKNGASRVGKAGIWKESAAEESLGEGVGVPVLDGSFGIDSKGLVFICDDGNIVRRTWVIDWVRVRGGTGNHTTGEREREGEETIENS